MNRSIFTFLVFFTFPFAFLSQNRTADGTNNNPLNTDWGSAGMPTSRILTNAFADGISSPAGMDRPNPRTISNELFDQSYEMPNALNLSDFWWQWGQFLDHDITEIPGDPSEFFPIVVPMGDPMFDPFNTGAVLIPQTRSEEHPGTGTSVQNPRELTNHLTSWIDASGVYGSDDSRMNYLRSFVDGKLRMSSGNYLPFNTVTGEIADAVDPTAPSMANENPFISKFYVAGDVRANEQTALLAMHTLFAREHNRLCDEILVDNPAWSDEEVFQKARKLVGAYIQRITYEEWLPASGIELNPYMNFNLNTNPALSPIFSGAAFRLGHTMIPSKLIRLDNNGDTIPEGALGLKFAFFNPLILKNEGGMEPVFKGMATRPQQEVDHKVVNDLRNFLFGPPGAGGLDLAALNINRGRDLGLPDFNSARAELGLTTYASFDEITSNTDLAEQLEDLYLDINNIDPWVGMLVEDHMTGKAFGETISEILSEQFLRLRDCDWFWFENDPDLSPNEVLEIKGTNLADIIRRNTSIENLQNEVFFAQEHQECTVDEDYGCIGCYAEGQPEPVQLSTQVMSNGYFLKWKKVPGSVACQVNGGLVMGPQVFINVYGTEPDQKYVAASALDFGSTYQWRVRCGCQINPNIIAGDWSGYNYFTHMIPGANNQSNTNMFKLEEEGATVEVYPNPMQTESTFIFPLELSDEQKTIEVYSPLGALVVSETVSSNTFNLERSNLRSGIYLYRIYSQDSEIDNGKLILQ
ncbi:MAG: peroxidase family protein [Bacteroidota bacterium]